MGFLSALGTGMMGAVAGGAESFIGSMDKKIDREAKMADLKDIEKFREQMLVEREASLKARKAEENKAVMGRAGELASGERGAQMDQAAEIYRKSGMSEADIALGVGATETARAEKVAPGREHLMAARGEMGLLSSADLVADMDKREQTDYARGRDATSDEFKQADDKRQQTNYDRSYELDKQRVAISAKQANSSIAASNIQLKTAQLAFKQAQETAKIPPMVKQRYETYEAEAKAIQSAMYKAEAEGQSNPESLASLAKQLSSVTNKMEKLANPYMPKEAKSEPLDKAAEYARYKKAFDANKDPAARARMKAKALEMGLIK